MNKFEEKVYPFTTEDISSYFDMLDMKDKSVLTVGSSGDQAYNALVCGAKDVTVVDINPNTERFMKIKRDYILNNSLEDLYQKVLSDKSVPYSDEIFSSNALKKMNNYMESIEKYQLLQDRLKNSDIKFIKSDIFSSEDSIDGSYDRIILSNVLQYMRDYVKNYEGEYNTFIRDNFNKWLSHLNEDGIIQLFYLYDGNTRNKDFLCFIRELIGNVFYVQSFTSATNGNTKSSIITYEKRK